MPTNGGRPSRFDNIGPTMEPIFIMNNPASDLKQRFYRIQKNPN